MSSSSALVLGSSSPRRRELLSQLGFRFAVVSPCIDETQMAAESPADYVRRMATEKAVAVAGRLDGEAVVLAADTVVVIDGLVLQKPEDVDACVAMLGMLSGRTHRVLSAVCLRQGERSEMVLSETSVRLRNLSAEEILRYWATGEPRDKAGGYGVQGLGAIFVERLEGSHSGVAGLPLAETARLLGRFGLDPLGGSGQV